MKRSFLSLLFLIILFSSNAQVDKFSHLTNKDGLMSEMVSVLLQDSDDFMWFGTNRGLCRYDGYSFLYFTYSSSDSTSLSNNLITSIIEDEKQNLWIGTNNGLNILNLNTYKNERLHILDENNPSTLQVRALRFDDNNCLWIGTYTNGLLCYNISTKETITYKYSEADTASICSNNVSCFIEDANGNLLIGNNKGLDLFDRETSTFKHLLKDIDVRSLSFNTDSSIFVGVITQDNYYLKLNQDFSISKIELPIEFSEKEVTSFVDSYQNQWISVKDQGILYFDAISQNYKVLKQSKYNPNGINSNVINAFAEDKWGNIWIGSFDSGINIYQKNVKPFIHIKDNFKEDGLRNNRVRSIYQDSDGDIWIGTKVNGTLCKFDTIDNSFIHYKHDPLNPSSISNDFIFCITEDKLGKLWVGTSNGLNLFDKKTGTFKRVGHQTSLANYITSNSVYSLIKDTDDLYIGHTKGVTIYNTINGNLEHYNSSNGLSDNRIRFLYKDSFGHIWIATSDGLNRFHIKTNKIKQFFSDPQEPNSISANIIICIHEDEERNLWFGTTQGLNKWNNKTEAFEVYTSKNGLAGNTVNGILNDELGNLWISTNNGLSKFNIETKEFKNYNVYDGLQANEFSALVYCKTKDGKMLFGGNNGFNIFHPKNIIDNKIVPNVMLTDFKLSNKKVEVGGKDSPLQNHISKSSEITLNHNQSVLTFEYVALNYISSQNNHYAYKLEGFEDDWNYVETKRDATYTNLNPGSYTFRVKASNNDGVWNEEGAALKINILPPPWLSLPAIIIYIFLCVSLIILLWRYSINRVKKAKELEQHQQNLQFFINLSHEFRTPLTLILNPISKLLAKEKGEDTDLIKNISISANKLMNLVNQILESRKSDLGRLSLDLVEADIVAHTNGVFQLFEDIGKSKGIQMKFISDTSSIVSSFDSDKLEKVLANLLSNAIKFTDKGGEITVKISEVSRSKKKHILSKTVIKEFIEISVSDTGVGLNKDQKNHIFERFYSQDKSKTGTGIGLNYTKSLVELHGGSISVLSERGIGSIFSVYLPFRIKSNSSMPIPDVLVANLNTGKSSLESLQYDILSDHKVEENQVAMHKNETNEKPTILIVEDNGQLRTQIKDSLIDIYTVVEAVNGSQALDYMKTVSPDLIISDIMMPIMDGVEMCKKLKSDLNTSHIPVILLTAKNLTENRIEGFDVGADEYISKPFNMDVLLARISNLLQSRNRLKEKFMSSHLVLPAYEFTSNKTDEIFLDEVTQIAIKNISNSEFKANDIRKEVNLSSTHFFDKIKALTNQNPSNFLRTIRLQYAAELIQKNEGSIKEICYQVGFNSPSYFTKSFKEMYGKTPIEYSKSIKE